MKTTRRAQVMCGKLWACNSSALQQLLQQLLQSHQQSALRSFNSHICSFCRIAPLCACLRKMHAENVSHPPLRRPPLSAQASAQQRPRSHDRCVVVVVVVVVLFVVMVMVIGCNYGSWLWPALRLMETRRPRMLHPGVCQC